jgi:hypothetical protein
VSSARRSIRLPLLYHAQDAPNYCGPCAAMMSIFDQLTVQVGGDQLQKKIFDLADQNRGDANAKRRWATTPWGLASALSQLVAGGRFGPSLADSFELALGDCRAELEAGKGVPVALYGGREEDHPEHWALLTGCELEGRPGEGEVVDGVWLQSSYYEQRGSMQHTAGDDCGAPLAGGIERVLNGFVPIEAFRGVYLVGTTYPDGLRRRFISVSPEGAVGASIAKRPHYQTWSPQGVKASEAVAAAVQAIEARGLLGAMCIADPQSLEVAAELPKPVRRVRNKDGKLLESYWLLTVRERSSGLAQGLVEIGTAKAQLRGLHLFGAPVEQAVISPAGAASRFVEAMPAEWREKLPPVPELATQLALVWFPCGASTCSSLPFYIAEGVEGLEGIFCRIDGQLLHDPFYDRPDLEGY